jgi:diguanylate cyclase (GGDEF)-like protein
MQGLLRIGAYVLLTLLVYWANAVTPPAVRLGILYIVPVLLVTWTEGLTWGLIFAAATITLREVVAWDQLPAGTPALWRVTNSASYMVVLGVAMAGLQMLRRSQAQLAQLAMHDLDDFKVINDSHGHQTGDAVLRLVADAMRSSVRQADLVGRLGGDEFAVLMPETDATVAEAAARRLAANLRNVFKGTPTVTASIGVVSCGTADATTDELLRRADQAMYDAKRNGKDRVVQVAM